MNYLAVEDISMAFADKVLFEGITFHIDKGQKVAFIAQNGTGKSTLMKIIAGKEKQDSGNIYLRSEIITSLLDQDPQFKKGDTVMDALFDSDKPAILAIKAYEESLLHPEDYDKMERAMNAMDVTEAWDYEQRATQILGVFNIYDLEQDANTLSGGQKKRLALAKALIDEPDFLILDEPTNHLDLEMIEWLEQYLGRSKTTIFMVTHDRYFLDNVCTEILELEGGELFKYKGKYNYYLEKKAEREASEIASVGKAKNLFKKELEWMRRMPQGRGTKAKSRVSAFYDVKDKASKNLDVDNVKLHIKMERLGGKVLELHNINKSFGDKQLIKDFSYKFIEGERIGIVGKNGSGKSTLLNLFTEKILPDTGKVVKGTTVVMGYYSQEGMKLAEDKRVIDIVKDVAEFIPIEKGKTVSASAFLERFLFPPEQQYLPVSKLSGGEKRRLYLMTILMTNPNFLILDEPTNDLDILTLNVLEDFLQTYQGCLLMVSHDRHFMDKLVDHLFIFEGDGKLKDYNGTYSEYRYNKAEQDDAKKNEPSKPKAPVATENKGKGKEKEKNKLSFNEQKELGDLTKEMEKLEKEKTKLTESLSSGTLSNEELQQAGIRLNEVVATLDTKTERWMELAELAEQYGQTDLI